MTLQSLAAQHRQAILARERAAGADLAGIFKATWARILARLQQLFAQMDAAEQHGQTINLAWLAESNRLQKVLADIRGEVGMFADAASLSIHAQMVLAAQIGQEDAKLLLKSRIDIHFGEPQEEALQALQDRLDSGPLIKRFAKMPLDAIERAKKTLMVGVTAGWSPARIASQLHYDMSIQMRDALRISRTEMMNAYREGTLSIYRANSDVVDGWEWLTAPGACPECAEMNGTKHSLDEGMDTHPNCFTGDIVVAGPKVLGSTTRWFDGEIVEIQTISGNRLTVTPNHPILTPEGWVGAGLLHEGSNVFRCFDMERIASTINPDNHQVPALIEEVAATFGCAGRMATTSMPTAAEDFHGDGAGSDVHVVRSYCALHNIPDVELISKPPSEQLLCWRHAMLTFLPSSGTAAENINTVMLPAPGGLRFDSVAPSLLRSTSGGEQPVGIGSGSQGNARIAQEVHDRMTANAVSLAQLSRRFPRQVALDEIVTIKRRPFSAHVYNLQTVEGWYIANNIITHNCRCTELPIVADLSDEEAA